MRPGSAFYLGRKQQLFAKIASSSSIILTRIYYLNLTYMEMHFALHKYSKYILDKCGHVKFFHGRLLTDLVVNGKQWETFIMFLTQGNPPPFTSTLPFYFNKSIVIYVTCQSRVIYYIHWECISYTYNLGGGICRPVRIVDICYNKQSTEAG